MNGTSGDITARAAPSMNSAPVVILNLVNKSDLTCAVRTFPEIRFPEESSSLTVTVASPMDEGIRLCQTILDDNVASVRDSNKGLFCGGESSL